jgi:Peptidase family M23
MAEISHQDAITLIQATKGGSTTTQEIENLARHLEACAACRAYASHMDTLEDSLRRCFHIRWDSTRGPSTWVIETIYKKTRANLMVRKISGFLYTAIAIGILAAVVIFATSMHPRHRVPLTGGQLNQTQTSTPIPTPTATTPEPAEFVGVPIEIVWVPPAYGLANLETASQMLGPGVCLKPVSSFIGTGTFMWPTKQHAISGYNYAPGIQHFGVDLAGSSGEPVYASDGGVVVYSGWNNWGLGIMIVIDHGNGKQTLYAHLGKVTVACGDQLDQGSLVGEIGMTGNTNGPHLYFEIIVSNERVNPYPYLPPP